MSERLDRVESLLLQMSERQMAHESRFERMDAHYERFQLQLSEINGALDKINLTLNRVVEGQDRNEQQIGANAEAIAQLRSESANTQRRVGALEAAS